MTIELKWQIIYDLNCTLKQWIPTLCPMHSMRNDVSAGIKEN